MSRLRSAFAKAWRIEDLALMAMAFWALAFVVSYLVLGRGSSSDLMTVAYGLIIAVSTGLTIFHFKGSRLSALTLSLGLMILLHVLPRVWEYIAVAKRSQMEKFNLFPIEWDVPMVNKGMAYVAVANVALLGGFWFARRMFDRSAGSTSTGSHRDRFEFLVNDPLAVVLAVLSVSWIEPYLNLHHGLSASTNCNPDIPMKWIINFFSPDIAVLGIVFLLTHYFDRIGRKWKFVYFALIAAYLVYTMALGSRGGVVRVALLFLFSAFVFPADFKIKLRPLMSTTLALATAAVVTFSMGTRIRADRAAACDVAAVGQTTEEAMQDPTYAPVWYQEAMRPEPENKNKIVLPYSLGRALDRLGILDYPVAFHSLPLDRQVLEERFTASYNAKTWINNIVPGTPFPGFEVTTSRLHPMLFRGYDFAHVNRHYLSEVYTVWGLGFIYFGYAGGIAFCFAIGLAISWIWLRLVPLARTHTSIAKGFAGSLFLFGILYCGVLSSQGFDHAGLLVVYFSLQATTFLAAAYGFNHTLRLVRRKVA